MSHSPPPGPPGPPGPGSGGIRFDQVEKAVEYILNSSTRGDAASVIRAFDNLPDGRMNLGNDKSLHLEKIFAERKPKVLAGLGGFLGSSAIRLGFAARKHNPDAHYYSIEINPILCCVIESLANFAGLGDAITVFPGDLTKNISTLKSHIQKRFTIDNLEFLLLDHWKDLYVSDVKLARKEGLLKKGSVVVGDNIIMPGAPEYRKYMETETVLYSSKLERIGQDALMVSIVN